MTVPPIADETLARLVPGDFLQTHDPELSRGERVELFFRLNGDTLSFWFALAVVGLCVGIGIYAMVRS